MLFRALPSAREYPDRLARAAASLAAAGRIIDRARATGKTEPPFRSRPCRISCWRVRNRLRTAAVTDAESVRKDAAHWIDLKQHLPQEVQDMERDYKAIHAVDLAAAAAAVQKAETDWPEKKRDLEIRLASARAIQTRSEQLWQSSTDRAAPPPPTITREGRFRTLSSRPRTRSRPAPPHCPSKPNSSRP